VNPAPITAVARFTRASAVLGLPLAAYGLSGAMLSHTDWSLCAFRHFTGLPCPLCGGTHAVFHLLRLDVTSAFEANAAVTVIATGFALAGLRYGLEGLTGRLLPAVDPLGRWRARMIRLMLALLGLNWIFMLWRAAPGAA
jgi:hypothetical protein